MVGVPLNMAQAAYKIAFKLNNSTENHPDIAIFRDGKLPDYLKDGELMDSIDLGIVAQATLDFWYCSLGWTHAARYNLARGMGII